MLMLGRRARIRVDQLPELPARQRVDAGRRLVEDQKVGIVDQRAAKAELLPHAARELPGRPVGERREPGAVEQLGDAPLPLGAGLPEQSAEKLDVLAHAEVGIEVLAEALRHVGDARADRCAVRGICHVAAENVDLAGLDLPGAGNDAQQRRLADAVGADQPDDAAGRKRERDAVERGNLAVTMR